ncbi:hypothetical protein C0Q70_12429 [Pomacea canaliculata]|uniref:SRCR domain-containing protein n=1 Tax=Pomacea canaliculata TaxID=400727 RepID=A0A2T7P1I3_POMCA|nr:hypothetical protein C0Q70_12429 [Pomacea canaliculata]
MFAAFIRLVNGSNPLEGRVEVLVGQVWGTVCDLRWDRNEAGVVCSMLGYSRLINEVGFHLDTFRDRVYGEVEQVKAQQVEILRGIADIQNRLKGGSGVPTIPSVPTTTPASNNSFIRLVNGSNPLEGRVEVLVGQVWGTVCDDYWDTKDAGVVCSMLGYSRGNAIAVSSAGFGSGSGPITFTGAQCEGNEVDLRHCPMNNSPFQVSEPLRVRRATNTTEPAVKEEELAKQGELLLALRLINEVGYNLNTFRDRVYDQLEQVKAQQVEILRGIADIQNRLKGGSGVPITPSVPTTTPASNNSFIRLVNGSNPLEGRVEVLVGQVWGTVCDDYWDTKDAGVACSMLGYSRENAIPVSSAGFGLGSGPITFTGAKCEGNEVDLRHCPMAYGPFQGGCSHREDAGVICRPLK